MGGKDQIKRMHIAFCAHKSRGLVLGGTAISIYLVVDYRFIQNMNEAKRSRQAGEVDFLDYDRGGVI